jgi:preprotein translocase subunit YajC
MDFLISAAHAQAAGGAAQPSLLAQFLPLILIFAVFYFLLIRPQMKRAKDHKNLVSNLAKGDEVVTNGGLLGRIVDLNEGFVTLELAENVKIKLQRQAVATVMPKGTVKSA